MERCETPTERSRVLPITADQDERSWVIRLDGDFNVTSAADLKGVLLEGLASGKDLLLDLEHAGEIDITVLQLLWAAGHEAGRRNPGMVSRVSEAAAKVAREAGFENFPGGAAQE